MFMACSPAVLDKLDEHTARLLEDPLGLALLNGTNFTEGMFTEMLEVVIAGYRAATC
jgi:hypothetical protein